MSTQLHIDIETFSSVDLKTHGTYNYAASPDFEILIFAYAYNDDPVIVIDLTALEEIPEEVINDLTDPAIEKHAHNALFERVCLRAYGYDTPAAQWWCNAVKAGASGIPLSLADAGAALNLGADKAKMSIGKKYIRYYCIPCKPTKVNGGRTRNYSFHKPEWWAEFLEYCGQDVVAEREIGNRLAKYKIHPQERVNYILDQKINDYGVLIDTDLAVNALRFDAIFVAQARKELIELTGVDNPNSLPQLKKWLEPRMETEIKSLDKAHIQKYISEAVDEDVIKALKLKTLISRTSIRKYQSMQDHACADLRARGQLQFQGAWRTGRWGGRGTQPHNLKRNYVEPLEEVRGLLAADDYEMFSLIYHDVTATLSELIRTSFIAPEGHTFLVADYSAIEARVIAWLANESWRIDVFNTHGKIYEASASKMFGVPIEQIGKGSDLRSKGKVAELALGYQGGVNALKIMGAEAMGLEETEMKGIVDDWRAANPNIVAWWRTLNQLAIRAVKTRVTCGTRDGLLKFSCDGDNLMIRLPSGRSLFYNKPRLRLNTWDKPAVHYMGTAKSGFGWVYLDTYGGKLAENIVQAVARDLLACSLENVDRAGFPIALHIHDEIVAECPLTKDTDKELERMCAEMGKVPKWATGLPLDSDGYVTPFYKKD